MDPATICGTISAAITFVEFTGRIIKTARDISDSKQGATRDNLELKDAVRGCQERLELLKTNFAADTVTSGDARRTLEGHISHCQTVNDRILKLLADTTAKQSSSSTSSDSWIRVKEKVSQVKGKIPYQWKPSKKPLTRATANSPIPPTLRGVISATLNSIWKKEEIEELHRKWKHCVQGLDNALHRFEIFQRVTQLQQFGKDIMHQLESLQVLVTDFLGPEMAGLRSLLVAYQEAYSFDACVERNKAFILRSLAYDGITRRWQQVKDPISDTFKWILESDQHSLKPWLTAGEGIYHVSGKPGSGKSTFMKLLETESRRPGSGFIFASFYAWKPDSDFHEWQAKDELFMELLLRSLLYMILQRAPDLMPIMFQKYWHPEGFTLFKNQSDLKLDFDDLSNAFEIILEKKANEIASRRFFFLIDGLDEFYDPDHHFKLAATIKGWCSSNIKICVSSREDNVYMDAFPESNRLHLHEVTKHDIQKLVKSRLEQHPVFLSDCLSQCQREDLIKEVVIASEGVFVWVIFTISELYRLLTDKQDYEELLSTIIHSKAHGSLEAFLKEIIGRIPEGDREVADLLFSIIVTLTKHNVLQEWRTGFYGLAHYWMATKYLQKTGINESSYNSASVKKISLSEVESKVQRFRTRLPTIARGLLEPVPNSTSLRSGLKWNLELQYTHRSVYDYLRSESFAALGSREERKTTDGLRLILESTILAAKAIMCEPGTETSVIRLHRDASDVLLHIGSDKNADTIAPFVQELDELLLRQGGHLVPVAPAREDTTEVFVADHDSMFSEGAIERVLEKHYILPDYDLWYLKWAASDRSHSWTRSRAFKVYLAERNYWYINAIVETGLISTNEEIGITVANGFSTAHNDCPSVTFPSIWTYGIGVHLIDPILDEDGSYHMQSTVDQYAKLFSMGAEPRVCFRWRTSLASGGFPHKQVDLPTTVERRHDRTKPVRSTLQNSSDKIERGNVSPQSVQHWKGFQRDRSLEMQSDMNRKLGVSFELGLVIGPESRPRVVQIHDMFWAPLFTWGLCQTYGAASGTVDLGTVIMSLCAARTDYVSSITSKDWREWRETELTELENARVNFLREYNEALLRVRREESPSELNSEYPDTAQTEQVRGKTPPVRQVNSNQPDTIGLVLLRQAHEQWRIWRSALCLGAAAVLLALILHRTLDVFSWDSGWEVNAPRV